MMCGLFGYIGPGAEPSIMKSVILEAAKRGVHSWGVVVANTRVNNKYLFDGVPTEKQIDAINFYVDQKYFQAYTTIIGHCRLATSGSLKLDDAQPLLGAQRAVVHNGTIIEYKDLYAEFKYEPVTRNDSEAILAVLSRARFKDLMDILGSRHYAIMSLDLVANTITLARNYHPLFIYTHKSGVYFCSRRVGDDYQSIPENKCMVFMP